jgi:biopolymer transport protein ExbB/TolQ
MMNSVSTTHGHLVHLGALALVVLLMIGVAAPAWQAARAEGPAAADAAPRMGPVKFFLASHGFIFGPLMLLIQISLLTLILLLAMGLRKGRAVPPAFVKAASAAAVERGVPGVVEVSRAHPSFVAHVLQAGVTQLGLGLDEARRGAGIMLEGLKGYYERVVRMLAMIGILSPLVGLAGTLLGAMLGLIEASRPDGTMASQALARGFAHSLVVLFHGVVLSVIAILAYTVFKNRLSRVALAAGSVSDHLLAQLHYRPH